MKRRTVFLWLTLFTAAAAFLRLYAITEVGIYDLDEGLYLVDAHAKWNEWHLCAELAQRKWDEMRGGPELLMAKELPKLRDALASETVFAGKHLYYYLIAFIMLFTGPVVWSGILIDAVAGIGSVWLIYAFVKRLYSQRAGLIAAGITTFSAYHVFYSRRVYGTAIIAFLFMAALYCHLRAVRCRDDGGSIRSQRLWLVACGAFAGLCFIINFQIAVLLPVLALVHVFTCVRFGGGTAAEIGCTESRTKASLRWLIGGGLCVLLGFAMPIACMEAASYPLILLFRSQGLQYPHGTFLELVTPKLTSHLGHAFYWSGFVLLPFFISVLEGMPALVLCVALPILALITLRKTTVSRRTRARTIIYLGCWFLIPFLIFSSKTPQSSRVFVNCLPPLFAALAVCADATWSYAGPRRAFARAAVALLLAAAGISSLVHNVELLRMRSAFPDVMRWLASTPERGASAPYGLVLLSYLRQYGLPGGSYTTYITYGTEPPPYFVTDRTELWDKQYPDTSVFVPEGAHPVKRFEHRFGRILLEAGAFPPEGNPLDNIRWVRGLDLTRSRQVLVYDIRTWEKRMP
ncbi:MAG: glycosyltransferase family 39 protein [Candidatus Hydrogenedentes bacterium]|nr:glycosyltransferase family 39 protein [Candidatus Hydrogenedentota bacterium]